MIYAAVYPEKFEDDKISKLMEVSAISSGQLFNVHRHFTYVKLGSGTLSWVLINIALLRS